MKIAIDTSVLVAALVEDHPKHSQAIKALTRGASATRIAHVHAYAETWAVLTAMPIEPRISGAVAEAVLERMRAVVEFGAPRRTTYSAAVRRCTERGVRSGAVYDAIHLVAAEEAGASTFLTFNRKDFERLAVPSGPRIAEPT